MKLVIVSGLSGAGKTVALKQYEDLGYVCIDNIPLALTGPMIARMLARDDATRYERLAIGVDARELPDEIRRFPQHLQRLQRRGVDVRVIFLTASDEAILRRYGDTRRPHPLVDERTSLVEAIARERELLAPIADLADEPLDTSAMNLHELRDAILQRARGPGGLCLARGGGGGECGFARQHIARQIDRSVDRRDQINLGHGAPFEWQRRGPIQPPPVVGMFE